MMRQFLVVTAKKSDLSLLTVTQRRVAAGLLSTDTSQDADLLARDLAVGAGIMAECRIAVGQGNDPTLFQETLTETFYSVDVDELMLARRHNIEIQSITVDGTVLTTDQYFVNTESGIITYLSSDCPRRWCARKIVVVYKAGFATVPPDLEQAALDYFRAVSMESDRDPYVKAESVEVPGLETRRTELWSGTLPGSASASGMPDSVSSQLGRFRNPGSI
jgi:hypothetical protein